MVRAVCSVRALKHNIRTLNSLNQDIIPVVTNRVFNHGGRVLKEISRSYRYQPLYVHDRADAAYLRANEVDNIIIQQVWDGKDYDRVIPVLTASQVAQYDTAKPFAVVSDYRFNVGGVSARIIPKDSNLAYVFFQSPVDNVPIDLTLGLQETIAEYKAINPNVKISIGSSVDALNGSGLLPRVCSPLLGYGKIQDGKKYLRPVKEVYADVICKLQSASADHEGTNHYNIGIGSSDGIHEGYIARSAVYEGHIMRALERSIYINHSTIESDVILGEGASLHIIGGEARRASAGMPFNLGRLIAELLVGNPECPYT